MAESRYSIKDAVGRWPQAAMASVPQSTNSRGLWRFAITYGGLITSKVSLGQRF
jgi:hypothetical protein